MLQYLVVVENNKDNFSAYSPDVPGCSATGNTIQEAVKEMKNALQEYIETLDEIPVPKGLNHYMNDDAVKKDSRDYVLQVQLDQDY